MYLLRIMLSNTIPRKGFEIYAIDKSSKDKLILTISDHKSAELLEVFNNDYDKLGDCIRILNRKLFILNPGTTAEDENI